jgi:hypothetical protein
MRLRRCRSTSSGVASGNCRRIHARDFAGEFVQIQRDFEALLAGHLAIKLDLTLECGPGRHQQS